MGEGDGSMEGADPGKGATLVGVEKASSLACKVKRSAIRCSRTFKRVSKRTMTLYEAGVSYETFPGWSRTTLLAALRDKGW